MGAGYDSSAGRPHLAELGRPCSLRETARRESHTECLASAPTRSLTCHNQEADGSASRRTRAFPVDEPAFTAFVVEGRRGTVCAACADHVCPRVFRREAVCAVAYRHHDRVLCTLDTCVGIHSDNMINASGNAVAGSRQNAADGQSAGGSGSRRGTWPSGHLALGRCLPHRRLSGRWKDLHACGDTCRQQSLGRSS